MICKQQYVEYEYVYILVSSNKDYDNEYLCKINKF